jgi:hypothetical protein
VADLLLDVSPEYLPADLIVSSRLSFGAAAQASLLRLVLPDIPLRPSAGLTLRADALFIRPSNWLNPYVFLLVLTGVGENGHQNEYE